MFGRLLRVFRSPASGVDRGAALQDAVAELEGLFVGWTADDPRWPLLCEYLGLAKESPPVRRPSQLVPYVRFEVAVGGGKAGAFFDPLARVAIPAPGVPAERIVTAARVQAGARAADVEWQARSAIKGMLDKERPAAEKQRGGAREAAEAVERATSELAGAEYRLAEQLRAWEAAREAVVQLRRREAGSAADLADLADLAGRRQAERTAALDAFAAIPTYPPGAAAESARETFERAAAAAESAVERARSRAGRLDADRADLERAVRAEAKAREELRARLRVVLAGIEAAGAAAAGAGRSATELELESTVTATRERLTDTAKRNKVDPARVLAQAEAEPLWTAVPCSQCPAKQLLVDRLRAAVQGAKAAARKAAARGDEARRRLESVKGGAV